MINTRDILMIASGVVLGGGIVAAAGYYGVIRKYIPLTELEAELDDVRRETMKYRSKLKELKDEYEERRQGLQSDDTAGDGTDASEGTGDIHEEVPEEEAERDDGDFEPEDFDPDNPPAEWDPWINGYYDPLICDDQGRYVIDEGNKRWGGPLNPEEQEMYILAVDEARDCMSGAPEIVDGVLMDIKENRFLATINEDEPSYLISEAEHLDKPDFIDTKELDYYEEDDILADGRNIIGQIDTVINPIVLNHFNATSQSGDPNVVWCRNDQHETDYEITRHDCSYQEAVLGVREFAVYKPPRKFNKEMAADMEETNAKRSSTS